MVCASAIRKALLVGHVEGPFPTDDVSPFPLSRIIFLSFSYQYPIIYLHFQCSSTPVREELVDFDRSDVTFP